MTKPPSTTLTNAQALARALPRCNPLDSGDLAHARRDLADLRAGLRDEDAGIEDALCAFAGDLIDLVERHGHISGRQALGLAVDLISQVVASLGGELEAEAPGPQAAASAAEQDGGRSLGLRLMDQRRLGEILVSMSMLSPEQVERAVVRQKASGKRFGEILIELGYLNRSAVEAALRMQRRNQGARSVDPWARQN